MKRGIESEEKKVNARVHEFAGTAKLLVQQGHTFTWHNSRIIAERTSSRNQFISDFLMHLAATTATAATAAAVGFK